MMKNLTQNDIEVMEFIHNRLIDKYNENENFDYMIKFKDIIHYIKQEQVKSQLSLDQLKQVDARCNFKLGYKFGYMSKEGFRHFPIIYFAYGINGFSICLLGMTITVKLW